MSLRDNQQLVYRQILERRNRYCSLLQEYKQKHGALLEQKLNWDNLLEILRSQKYRDYLGEVLYKYEQFNLIRQQYQEVKELDCNQQEKLNQLKFGNQLLRDKIEELNYQKQMQNIKMNALKEQSNIYLRYLDNLCDRKKQYQEQIQELMVEEQSTHQNDFKQKMIQKLTEGGMLSEQDTQLIREGRFTEYVVKLGCNLRASQKQNMDLINQLSVRYNQYQQLKLQQQNAQRVFEHYYDNNQPHSQDDLAQQEQQLQSEIMELTADIEREKEKQIYLEVNCESIAHRQAVEKAMQLAQRKQKEIDRKKAIINKLLPVIAASNQPHIIAEISSINEQIKQLQEQQIKVRSQLFVNESAQNNQQA